MELDCVRVERQESVASSARMSSCSSSRVDPPHRDRRRERLNTELLSAVAQGDRVALLRLLEDGASVNATCRESGQTCLHAAASLNHTTVAELLLSKGAKADARDRKGCQPLHLAAWKGHLTLLTLLVDYRPDLVSSPVQAKLVTCAEGDLDSWNHRHDNLGEKSSGLTEGSTALHLACKRSHTTCVNFLLSKGACVDAKDAQGLTPLDVIGTFEEKPQPLPVVQEEEGGDDGGIKVSYDSVPVRPARLLTKLSPVKNQTVTPPLVREESFTKHAVTSIAKSLLEVGAKMPLVNMREGSLKKQTKTKVTALHTAVKTGNMDLVNLLLDERGCLLSWDERGDTPLHLAVRGRAVEPLKAMLGWAGAPPGAVDARDSSGRTLLHLAVMMCWAEGVSFLLENGADVKASSSLKENVFHLVAERNQPDILRELLSTPDAFKVLNDWDTNYQTPVCRSVSWGCLESTKLLVESGADPGVVLPGDVTPVHLAAENDFTDVLDYLVNCTEGGRAVRDARSRSEKGGTTPLHSAALLGFADCVRVLLEAGADPRAVTTEEPHLGSTALHLGARQGHEDVVSAVLAVDPGCLSVTDSRGWFPLHVAASRGHSKCVAAMIRAGADLSTYITDEKQNRLTGLEIILYCVPQPLDFFESTLDSYMTVNEYPISDPNCEIELKFDLLTPNPNSTKQLKVLNAMLNSGKDRLLERLLLHPIVETFLHLKWRKLRYFFVVIMAFYLMFTFSLTALAMMFYVFGDADTLRTTTFHCTLFFSLIPIIVTEGLNVIQLERYYVCDYESWVKWLVFVCSIVVGLADPFQHWWSRHLTSVVVLLAWLELLFLVARCPTWGFYVLMFSRVASKIIKVLLTFTFLLIGFTFAFMIEFNAQDPFSTLWKSLVKITVMMIEFDYESTFENVGDLDWLSFVSRSLFLMFIVLVAIVLMNLMVGLAVSDIALLETQGRTQRLAKQISFLSLLEVLVGSGRVARKGGRVGAWITGGRAVPPTVVVRAGGASLHCAGLCLPRYLRESITEKVCLIQRSAAPPAAANNIGDRLDRLATSREVANLKEALEKQSAAIEQILKQLKALKPDTDIEKNHLNRDNYFNMKNLNLL